MEAESNKIADIQIRKLSHKNPDKFIDLLRLFEDVFDIKNFVIPDKIYLQHLLEKDDFFVFVALSKNTVVAGLTSYTLQQYYSKSPLVYIYDLAVKTEYQRRGIANFLSHVLHFTAKKLVQMKFFCRQTCWMTMPLIFIVQPQERQNRWYISAIR